METLFPSRTLTRDDAEVFLTDLANRMSGRIQLSADGHRIYEGTVGPSFANNVDWAQIQKHYAGGEPGEYSPPVCIGTKRRPLKGDPDPDPDLDQLRRAAEPHDADGDAALHLTDQWIQSHGREPGALGLSALHALQLRAAPQRLEGALPPDASDGGWGDGSHLELGRDRGGCWTRRALGVLGAAVNALPHAGVGLFVHMGGFALGAHLRYLKAHNRKLAPNKEPCCKDLGFKLTHYRQASASAGAWRLRYDR
jgi:hypothetical protein